MKNLIGQLLIIFTVIFLITVKDSLAKDNGTIEIVDVLPKDAIQAIKEPQFVSSFKANIHLDEPVIGVSFNGEEKAYSIYLLNNHEIVNDIIGGKPIAVTW